MSNLTGAQPFANPRSFTRFVSLATVLVAILSGILFVAGLLSALRAADEAGWREVQAEVVDVAVADYAYQTSKGSSRTGTQITVTYRYSVDGQTYTSARYSTSEASEKFTENSDADVKRRLGELAKSKQLTAYVSPDDPAGAVLEREELVPAVIVTAVGALLLLLTIAAYVWWRWRAATTGSSSS